MRFFQFLLLAAVLAFTGNLFCGAAVAENITANYLAIGTKIYRDGILSDGSPAKALVKGDVEILGSQFSCENCHTRSGIGSTENQIFSPSVNGTALYKSKYFFNDEAKNRISKSKGVTRPARELRPAYTDETLAFAIRHGADPTGREFLPLMPRYQMNDKDMQLLISYLKTLSTTHSPGIDDKTLRLATIVTDDVSKEDRQAMLASLETLVTINQQTKTQRKDRRFFKMFRMIDASFFKEIKLDVWELKGEPDSWKEQLEKLYQANPVFALLGGISNRPWQEIHRFCEAKKLPNIMPITDLPVIENGWYTYYASKGYSQEGETAARYIFSELAAADTSLLQFIPKSERATAAANGFNNAKADYSEAKIQIAEPFAELDKLKTAIINNKPDILIFWGGKEELKKLLELPQQQVPNKIILSSRIIDMDFEILPEQIRERVYLTYPFRLPEEEKKFEQYTDALSLGKLYAPDKKRIATRTYTMIHTFLLGLKEMRFNYYRDAFVDVISMLPDQNMPDFVRQSFGPGQRFASKGCYVVQLTKDNSPKLVPKSDWVVF